jgi:hypothetical protein
MEQYSKTQWQTLVQLSQCESHLLLRREQAPAACLGHPWFAVVEYVARLARVNFDLYSDIVHNQEIHVTVITAVNDYTYVCVDQNVISQKYQHTY